MRVEPFPFGSCFYLYIGITSCDYKIPCRGENCKMGCCTKIFVYFGAIRRIILFYFVQD